MIGGIHIKKSLFGYSITDANMLMNTLREENYSLSTTIVALQKQLEGYDSQEAEQSQRVDEENRELKERIASLEGEAERWQAERAELLASREDYESRDNERLIHAEKDNRRLSERLAGLEGEVRRLEREKSELLASYAAASERAMAFSSAAEPAPMPTADYGTDGDNRAAPPPAEREAEDAFALQSSARSRRTRPPRNGIEAAVVPAKRAATPPAAVSDMSDTGRASPWLKPVGTLGRKPGKNTDDVV